MLEAAKLRVGIVLGAWRERRLFLAVTIKGEVILHVCPPLANYNSNTSNR